jgi:hypothetical protein
LFRGPFDLDNDGRHIVQLPVTGEVADRSEEGLNDLAGSRLAMSTYRLKRALDTELDVVSD